MSSMVRRILELRIYALTSIDTGIKTEINLRESVTEQFILKDKLT